MKQQLLGITTSNGKEHSKWNCIVCTTNTKAHYWTLQ